MIPPFLELVGFRVQSSELNAECTLARRSSPSTYSKSISILKADYSRSHPWGASLNLEALGLETLNILKARTVFVQNLNATSHESRAVSSRAR